MYATHSTRCSNRPRLELGQQSFLVIIWDCANNVYQPRDTAKAVLLAHLRPELIERYSLVCIMGFDELSCDTRGYAKQGFCL